MKEVEKRVCKLLDKTGYSNNGFRGDEIKEWLNRHPEVTQYAILEDDEDFYPDQHLFKTSWQTGLTEEIMKNVINHLNQ